MLSSYDSYFLRLVRLSSVCSSPPSISFCVCAGYSLNSPWQKPLKHTNPHLNPVTQLFLTTETCNMFECTHNLVLCIWDLGKSDPKSWLVELFSFAILYLLK